MSGGGGARLSTDGYGSICLAFKHMHYGLEPGWPFSWTLKGLLHMAVLIPPCSPTLLTYFLFPSMASSGSYFNTAKIFPSNNVGFGPGREPNGRRARAPPNTTSSWQEGTKAQGHRPAWATWATGEPAPRDLGDSRSSPERQP